MRAGPRAGALGAALLALGSSGCSLLFPSRPSAEQTYVLRAAGVPQPAPPLRVSVRVLHPMPGPGLDSPRIVLLELQHRMGFYARSHWPAALPDVVESLSVETLRNSASWSSVADSTSPFPTDYLLQITVRRFEADYGDASAATGTPVVHVVLECLLGRADGRDVIASYVAEGRAAPQANRLADVVAAFQEASNAAMKSLSERAFEAVKSDAHRPG